MERLEGQVKGLATIGDANSSDIVELERSYQQEISDDLRNLRDELYSERIQGLASKDVITTFIGVSLPVVSTLYSPAAALNTVFTVAGLPISLGGLIGVRGKWLKACTDVLKKHPMAYIYELRRA